MIRHRSKFVLFCTIQLVVTGCMQRTVGRNGASPFPRREKNALSLSDYIRTVYKISEENTVESEEARRKVLAANPELAQLAGRVAADPKDVDSRNLLAQGYLREGLLWSAYHLFHESRNLADGNFVAEFGLGQIWDKWGDYSLARQHTSAAVAINPASSEAYELLGRIHLHRNAAPEAVEAFKYALELDPERANTLANLGYAYMLSGNNKDAKLALTKAVTLDPSLTEAHNNLGILLAQAGDYQGSLAEMQKVSSPQVALNNLGAVLLAEKKPAEAAQAFQQALEKDPTYTKAADNLAIARAVAPPPAVVTLPSFGAPKAEAKRPVEASAPKPPAQVAAQTETVASTPAAPKPIEPAVRPVESPKPQVVVAPKPVPQIRKITTEAVKPAETPRTVVANPTSSKPSEPKAIAVAPVAPASAVAPSASTVEAPPSKNEDVTEAIRQAVERKSAERKSALAVTKSGSEPSKPAKAAPAQQPEAPATVSTSTPEPAPVAAATKTEEKPSAAAAPSTPSTPSLPALPTPIAIYAAVGVVGLGVMTWLSSKMIATMRTKRAIRRAFLR